MKKFNELYERVLVEGSKDMTMGKWTDYLDGIKSFKRLKNIADPDINYLARYTGKLGDVDFYRGEGDDSQISIENSDGEIEFEDHRVDFSNKEHYEWFVKVIDELK